MLKENGAQLMQNLPIHNSLRHNIIPDMQVTTDRKNFKNALESWTGVIIPDSDLVLQSCLTPYS